MTPAITSLQNPCAPVAAAALSLGKSCSLQAHRSSLCACDERSKSIQGRGRPSAELARFVQVSGENRPLGLRGEKQRPCHRPSHWAPGRRGAGRDPGDTYRCAHGCSHSRMRESTRAHTYTDAHIHTRHTRSHLHGCTHPHTLTHAHTYTDAIPSGMYTRMKAPTHAHTPCTSTRTSSHVCAHTPCPSPGQRAGLGQTAVDRSGHCSLWFPTGAALLTGGQGEPPGTAQEAQPLAPQAVHVLTCLCHRPEECGAA